jgi:hypothetical protein
MKKLKKYLRYLLAFTTITFLTNCEFSNKLDEFNTVIELEAVKNKKHLFFKNANPSGTEIKNITVSFSGDIQNNIFSILGKKVSKIDENTLVIGLRRSIVVSDENPEITIMTVEADGFITKKIPLLFNGQELENVTISLLEKENLPKGIQIIEQKIALNNGALDSNVNVQINNPNNNEDLLSFGIDAGTTLKDKDGNAVIASNLSLTIQTYDTKANSIENQGSYSPVSELTSYINYFEGEQIIPFSAFKIDIKANGEKVFLSKPFSITLPDPSDEIVATSKSNKKNASNNLDLLSIFSFPDEPEEIFPLTPPVSLDFYIDANGNITFHPHIPTSGLWVFGRQIPVCSINLKFNNSSIGTKYQIQAASILAPERLLDFEEISIGYNETFSVDVKENINAFSKNFSFKHFPVNARLKIIAKLIDGTSVVVYDKEHTNCSLNNTEIDVTVPNQNSVLVDLDMDIQCRNERYNLPRYDIYYNTLNKAKSAEVFLYGIIKEGRLTGLVPQLESNTNYFFIATDGEKIGIKGNEANFLRDRFNDSDFCAIIGR